MNSIDEVVRVAVVAEPSRLSGSHARLVDALSQSTLPGFHVDLPGSGVRVGTRHDLIHLLTPDASVTAIAAEHGIGLLAGYPAVPGHVRPGDCRLILSPGPAADSELSAAGAQPRQLARWQPGVDPESFGPAHYRVDTFPRAEQRINVLHVGPPPKPVLLAAAFGAAAAVEPRLHLVDVAPDDDLPRVYASADLLLDLSTSADFPLAIIEAQASGLPVLALHGGGASELIEDGRTGVLAPATPGALAEALVCLARRLALRERLTVGGLGAIRTRTWARSLHQLTSAWTSALTPAAGLLRAA